MKVSPAKAVSIFLSCTVFAASASSQTAAPQSTDDIKRPVIRFVMNKLIREHISPRPVNDSFSVAVFREFLLRLDPQHNIFLQADIDRLQAQQFRIDEQLMNGSAAFFDSAVSIYTRRIAELQPLCRQLLEKPLHLDKNERLVSTRQFPVSNIERTSMWSSYLRKEVLKKCAALAGSQVGLPPVTETRARESVLKMYDDYFSLQLSGKGSQDKFNAYVNVVAFLMDPHTTYTGPDYAESFPGIDGKPYFGLGLELENSGRDIIIKRIISGSTVDKSGAFRLNQKVVAVQDKTGKMVPVTGMQAREVQGMLSVPGNDAAVVKLENEDLTEHTVTVPREEMIMLGFKPRSAVLVQDGVKYGYIALPMFFGGKFYPKEMNSGLLVEKEIEKLKAQDVKALILDLRGNPGGAVDVAQYTGGLFGLKNVMSITVAKFNATFERPGPNVLYTDPFIVMTDESSASASEIFAGAVQDEGRGIVIGAGSTYGKATGQVSIAVTEIDSATGQTRSGLGYLNLTIKKIYRGNGTSNQIRGVIPDIILPEKKKISLIRERDYPTALPGGFYKEADYKKGKRNFDYELVVKLARARIAGNPAMQAGTGKQSLLVENSLPEWMNPDGIHPFQLLEYHDWLKSTGKDPDLQEAVRVAKDMVAHPKIPFLWD